MDKSDIIKQNFSESIRLKKILLNDEKLLEEINSIATTIIDTYRKNGKVLFCGNGGSAADAQHLSAELSGKYYMDRPALHAEALHLNTSYITAVANDYSFDLIYSRLVKAIVGKNDVLMCLSTSGNSKNVINALIEAKKLGCTTIGLTGEGGGNMKPHCDILIPIPSKNTPRIQECHMNIGHSICEIVEATLFQ